MKYLHSIFILLTLSLTACKAEPAPKIKPDQETVPGKHTTITLGGGCYWCVEAVFQQLDGVASVTSGFMGGHVPNPTYKAVCEGFTGHIEVIKVVYDPKVISTKTILKWFWKAHDPTNPLGQGADIGERYTSHIFYHNEKQKADAEWSKKTAQAAYDKPIVTKIRKAGEFYKAQEDHQNYYARMKNKNPYCTAVITPKLEKLNLEK